MVTFSCCVINCKNTGRNSDCKFYSFPTASWKLEQRKKWINAVKRKNLDGSPWTPKRSNYICSDHFVGGKKSEEEASPSYIPTIFPSIYNKSKINEAAALSRHKRFMNRRLNKKATSKMSSRNELTTPENNEITITSIVDLNSFQRVRDDKECQVNFFYNSNETGKTFICNKYIYVNVQKCDAAIQTDIMDIQKNNLDITSSSYQKRCHKIEGQGYSHRVHTNNVYTIKQ